MIGVLGTLLLFLPERRLVDQQVRPLRRIHDAGTGTRVARDHEQPAGTVRADEISRCELPPVIGGDGLALGELAPQRPLRNPRRPRLLRIEPPAPLVLGLRVADARPP